jgi:glutaredoxin-dependent peroxiredoxin
MELLRDRGKEFSEAGVRVLGASRDSPWTHIAWAQALELDFPLLSDWNAEAVSAFGISHEHRGMQDVAERSAFLIDTDGTVRGAWRYGTTELPDMDELVSAAQALSS